MKSAYKLTLLAALLTAAAPKTSTLAQEVNGNWIWITPGRNGAPDKESILSLKPEGAHLTGKISAPGPDGKPFDTPIANGSVHGDRISFDVIRRANGGATTNAYAGKVSADRITGTISFTRGGASQSRAWEARNNGGRSEAAAVPPPRPGYNEQGYKIVNETRFKDLSVEEIEKYLADHPDAVILDLRPAAAYAAGHLKGAVNLDVTDDNHYKDALKPLDKRRRYVVHSVTGHYRTVRALEYFEANGFEHAVAIEGGYQAWVAAGKPVVK
ncbi:MAG: rhodanese-like domain-containing protein [Verrucomicrobiae bacterium]|nr:rhodanese-like domain-containing protein [Verrucomicrobiae bacterium]